MTTGPHEHPFAANESEQPRFIVTDRHGREISHSVQPEHDEGAGQELKLARAAYVDVVEPPVIDGAIRTFLSSSPTRGGEIQDRRNEYFNMVTSDIQARLEAGNPEEHSETNTRVVELAGNEWEAFNGALYEARGDQEAPGGSIRRRLGGKALFAAEGIVAAGITHYTHMGPRELLVPITIMGTTAALTRYRPDVDAIDKVFPPTQDRGPIESSTVKLLNELGLKEETTVGVMRQAMNRWLKRNNPSRLNSKDRPVYESVERRLSKLTDDIDIDEFRIRSAVELTFTALEQAQHEALGQERTKENKRRWAVGGIAYMALLGAMYLHGVGDKEEITPNEHGPSMIEPTPTNSGPDDGVSEEPLPSDVPSEGYFDNN